MNREERERLVDGALARALSPEAAEPRTGFEQRLLANLAAQPERGPSSRWLWVAALAAAAVLAIAIVVIVQAMRRPVSVIETHRNTVPSEQPLATAKAPNRLPQVPRPRVNRPVRPPVQLAGATPASTDLPRQEVFPTPVPATEQEYMLLALVHRRPRQVREIAAEQAAERVRTQKFFDSGDGPDEPATAQQMR
jgi:hypothetical protein